MKPDHARQVIEVAEAEADQESSVKVEVAVAVKIEGIKKAGDRFFITSGSQ